MRPSSILLATAVSAVGVPASAAAWLAARTATLAAHLGAAGGVAARIGRVDADLTGAIRLSDVALGELVTADAVEASVALDSLLAGALRADEIRVAAPRVAAQVDGDGDSDLARLARRLLPRGGRSDGEPAGRLRRIVVSSGTLSARIAGLGELTAAAVAITPDAAGVRVTTGAIRLAGRAGPVAVELGFARGAADVTLPHLQFRRVLAVAGAGAVSALPAAPGLADPAAAAIRLRDVVVGRLVAGGPLELRAAVDDDGVPRQLAIDVAPRDRAIAIRGDRIPLRALAAAAPRGLELGAAHASGTLAVRAAAGREGGRPLSIDERSKSGGRGPDGSAGREGGRPLSIDERSESGGRGPDGSADREGGRPLSIDERSESGGRGPDGSADREGGLPLSIDVDGEIDGVAIDHRVLAQATVPLAGEVHASLAITPDAITVPRAGLALGAARWTLSGWLRRGAPASGQLDLTLATAPCGDLLAALPDELRGPLDGMALDGTFGAHLRLAVDLAAPPGDGIALTTSIADECRAVAEPPAADVARLAGTVDQVFPDGSRARIGKGEPGWAPLAQLPRHVAGAFVAAEDSRFFDHAGFDLDQIARSLEIDLREHRLVRGGSTISQQLVKNAFLSQRRSFDRKLQEAILTWRLEARLDKHQILERYLNLIELGPHVHGITAAARHWFGATPRELSVRQAAFLAALTSEPTSMSRRVRRAGGLDPDSAARVDVVLRAMHLAGAIDAAELDAARTAPLRFTPAAVD